jgi:hypothetical protein
MVQSGKVKENGKRSGASGKKGKTTATHLHNLWWEESQGRTFEVVLG